MIPTLFPGPPRKYGGDSSTHAKTLRSVADSDYDLAFDEMRRRLARIDKVFVKEEPRSFPSPHPGPHDSPTQGSSETTPHVVVGRVLPPVLHQEFPHPRHVAHSGAPGSRGACAGFAQAATCRGPELFFPLTGGGD